MLAQVGNDQLRERDGANTRLGLGRPEPVALPVIVKLAGDPNGSGVQVDIRRGERGELTPAQAGERSEQDQRPVAKSDRSGATVDFSDASDWSYPPAFPWTGTPPPGVKLP
jgi:hypothetical protein